MTLEKDDTKCLKVLLDLRPAFENFSGIPQESRLLFRGLRMLKSVDTEGLLQMSYRVLSKGTSERKLLGASRKMTEASRLNQYSRLVISASDRPFRSIFAKALAQIARRRVTALLCLLTLLRLDAVRLSAFRTTYFEDFIWRTLFAKTLHASDFRLVTSATMKVCTVPWNSMQMVGLTTGALFARPWYPRLNTKGFDIFISQNPYPATLHRDTALVVRYHDALPILMPHTIPDRSYHQASHFNALTGNVMSGAYFACVSEATRKDLLQIYPEIGARAVTIHNMVSHHYFQEQFSPHRIPAIIRSRLYALDPDARSRNLGPAFVNLAEQEAFYAKALSGLPLRYLMIVSTIEPRKNHLRLVAAWEALKAEVDPDLKLLVVGTLGWDNDDIVKAFKPWIDRGELFLLHKVPAPELRVLYRHASATVCPSLGEGFDFSGAESMRSGGIVIASDIAVHREIYDGAADYFDPYSTTSLTDVLTRTLYAPDAEQTQARLRTLGQEVGARYEPEKILPQWSRFLARVAREQRFSIRGRRKISDLDTEPSEVEGTGSPQSTAQVGTKAA